MNRIDPNKKRRSYCMQLGTMVHAPGQICVFFWLSHEEGWHCSRKGTGSHMLVASQAYVMTSFGTESINLAGGHVVINLETFQ